MPYDTRSDLLRTVALSQTNVYAGRPPPRGLRRRNKDPQPKMVTMAAAALVALSITLLLLPSDSAAAAGRLVLEEGYAVTTLLDGNKPGASLHPYALLPLPDARRGDRLFLLDATGSAFYALSLPVAQGSEIKRLSGSGAAGFSDGDASSAMFKNPRSFAVDSRGNLYVADRSNFAIRKISPSGMTTTIAGGYSQNKTGHVDGPAQNATFSNDFELVFVPQICALLISDRGNRLIRQIILKADDCGNESHYGLGTTSVSLIAVVCVLLGSVLGFMVHYFYSSRAERLRRVQLQQDMEALPNSSGGTSSDTLLRQQKRSC